MVPLTVASVSCDAGNDVRSTVSHDQKQLCDNLFQLASPNELNGAFDDVVVSLILISIT